MANITDTENRSNGAYAPSLYDSIPDALKACPQWACYRLRPRNNGDGKFDKIPFIARTGKQGVTAKDDKTWSTFAEAVRASPQYDGIGFIFTDKDPFCGIDLDNCRDPATGRISDRAFDLVQQFDSYTEISVSGKGLHIICNATLPGRNKKDHENHVEFFESSGFVAITGDQFTNVSGEIEDRQEQVSDLYYDCFPPKEAGPVATGPFFPESYANIKAMLALLKADKYDLWLRMGMALHSQDQSREMFEIWREWSETCRKKYDLVVCERKWRSFRVRPGGVTIGTLKYLAKEKGWTNRNGTGSFRLTETGNAERLTAQHGHKLRWVEPWKKWLVYDGTHWTIDTAQYLERLAKEVVRGIYAEAGAETEDDARREKLARFALASESKKARANMIELAKSEDHIPALPDLFDRDAWLLNVSNGTLNLQTGELRPHNPQDYITKHIPIAYDSRASCPQWESFLGAVFNGETEVIAFVKKAIGHSLTGDVREDCLFLCYGLGANGKSTFLNTIRVLLGDYGKQAAFSTFLHKSHEGIPNDVADLAGTRLVVASEAEEGQRFSMNRIKQFTGKDKIKARFLHCEYFEFPPTMKIWLAANHKPEIRSTDHGTWRRWHLIPFTRRFDDKTKDPTMGTKLLAELPGILTWAVQGCLLWQREGLERPEIVRAATAEYRSENDKLGAFLAECCEIDPHASAITQFLYDAYTEWCRKSGEEPKTKTMFGILLKERGFEPDKVTGLRAWIGLRLL